MRSTAVIALLVSLAPTHASGGVIQSPDRRIVTVCVDIRPSLAFEISQAQAKTVQMLADIGVKIEWKQTLRACRAANGETIIVSLTTGVRPSTLPGALAYAKPGDKVINVFYDRVLGAVSQRRVPTLLAHVFAHELGHVLEHSSHHSEQGIMKARWDQDDMEQMSWKPLHFAPEDVEMIRGGNALAP